jgi:polyisoprenoid-binding protein YceI
MRKVVLFAALCLGIFSARAQTKSTPSKPAPTKTEPVKAQSAAGVWDVDVVHSNVRFVVPHLTIAEVEGRFKMFTGTIQATTADFSDAKITYIIDAASINTENPKRDEHLRSPDFFEVEKFPKINFIATSFKKVKNNQYVLEGNLTIKDVTQKVTFQTTYGGIIKDQFGNVKAGFKATGKISRKAFGLSWNTLTDAGGIIVGDEVNMIINTEFKKAG